MNENNNYDNGLEEFSDEIKSLMNAADSLVFKADDFADMIKDSMLSLSTNN